MGYSTTLLSPPVEDEFLCPICHDVLQDPAQFDPCEHLCCRGCISQWRKGKTRLCPLDRAKIKETRKPHRLFLSLLQNLKMGCPFSVAANGCPVKEIRLGDFAEHDEICRFNPENQVPCAGECGMMLTQRARKNNTHNCVQYLKEQREQALGELLATKEKLKNTEGALAKCRLEVEAARKRDAGAGTSTSADGPPSPKRPRGPYKPAVPVVTCIRKWGVTDDVYDSMCDVIQIYAAVARDFDSYQIWCFWYMSRLRREICRRVPSIAYLGRLEWVEIDKALVATPTPEEKLNQSGLLVEVDGKLRVLIEFS